jgi:hypothetical protein
VVLAILGVIAAAASTAGATSVWRTYPGSLCVPGRASYYTHTWDHLEHYQEGRAYAMHTTASPSDYRTYYRMQLTCPTTVSCANLYSDSLVYVIDSSDESGHAGGVECWIEHRNAASSSYSAGTKAETGDTTYSATPVSLTLAAPASTYTYQTRSVVCRLPSIDPSSGIASAVVGYFIDENC